MKRIINPINRIETETITENIIEKFINQRVLVETSRFCSVGNLNKFKGNYALFVNNQPEKAFKLEEINKLSGKNKQTNLFETIVKCGDNSNSWCVKSEKTKKNLGGPYKTKDKAVARLKQVEYFKSVKEDIDLLLKEKLLHKFFKIDEEIVNPQNIGKLTPQKTNPRAKSRDRFAKSSKNTAKPLPGTGDTEKEAKYRFATYVELRKTENGGEKPKSKSAKAKK